jgi:hypothetical protein
LGQLTLSEIWDSWVMPVTQAAAAATGGAGATGGLHSGSGGQRGAAGYGGSFVEALALGE